MDTDRAPFHDELPLLAVGPSTFEIDNVALKLDPEALSLQLRQGPLCFVDLEATGLDAGTESLIEVGAGLVGTEGVEDGAARGHRGLLGAADAYG